MLTLRRFRDSDFVSLITHLADPDIAAIFPDGLNPHLIFCDPSAYVIALNDEMIGAARLSQHPFSDFSYWIAAEHRGKGYATRINQKLCQMAISLGWKQITGQLDPANTASIIILLRCGFHKVSETTYTKYL